MVTIEVKTIPTSNTKPRRLCAYTVNGQRLVMSYSAADNASNDSGNGEKAARHVAQCLSDKMGWGPLGQGGGTKAGWVFCFPDKVQA